MKLVLDTVTKQAFETHQQSRLAQFDRLVAEARQLYDLRNRHYRDSARTLGVLGVLFEFNGIAGRLRALRDELGRAVYSPFAEEEQLANVGDSLRDKLLDTVVYGVIALILLEDGNLVGE